MNEQMITALVLATLAAMTFSVRAYPASGPGPGGSIQITSPQDGATINGQSDNELMFDVHPSPDGNHVHIYVDDGRPTIVRKWKDSFTLPMLSPGKHEICVKEAMVNHILAGLQKCISVTAK